MFVLVFLIICMSEFFALLNGEKVDLGNELRQWQDVENFVYQKLERLLAVKDERVDQLQSILTNQKVEIAQLKQGMASLKQEILHKNGIMDKLVNRITKLERTVRLGTIPQESEHLRHSTSLLNKRLDKLQYPVNETTSLRQGIRSPPSANEILKSSLRLHSDSESKDNILADSLHVIERDEAARVSRDEFSSLQQKRISPRQTIAFHVALSANKDCHPDNTVVYDKEKLDHGDGYNPVDGIYIAPESGNYVFTWTSICDDLQRFQTVIVVNGAYMGSSWTDAQEVSDAHQSTAVAVLTLIRGDHVFIRMGNTYGQGTMVSRSILGESTFSGWKLD